MKEELEEMIEQEQNQYILLEKKIYTEEIFLQRNKALNAEMEELKTRIFEASKILPKEVDYEGKILTLKKAISALRDDSISVEAKNKLLKTIIKRIDYEYIAWEGKGQVKYKLHIELLV